MKIGGVEPKNNIFLAPMAGITDKCFRLLCKEQGAGLVYSEMVSAKALCFENKKTAALMELDDAERPAAVQLFGSDPALIAQSARELQADIIDINMGCPAPKIVNNGDGAAIMRDLVLLGEIVSAASECRKPVTVKLRTGWDEENINVVEAARIAERQGAAAVTVHGRTRSQFYSGKADWDSIKSVKEALNIPVIANGDIFTAYDAQNCLNHTKCDAVMLARGAQGNPWIFAQCLELLNEGTVKTIPDIKSRYEMALRHARMLVELKGEYIGIREARKHISWYVKGLPGATAVKRAVNHLESIAALEEMLCSLSPFRTCC